MIGEGNQKKLDGKVVVWMEKSPTNNIRSKKVAAMLVTVLV